MNKRADFNSELKELIEMTTHVFGEVEELGADDLREMLEISGPGADQLSAALYNKLKKAMEEMRKAGTPVPERYKEVLEQVRPLSERTGDPRYMLTRARAWIEKMLQDVKAPPRTDVAVAFRNRGELSENDERILNEAAERVKKRAREHGQT